ncbi:hypothetical protein KEHDKFFH_16425 [Marinobacter maroccanus]|uniref:Uncharacterized protein n=2 Tax=Marinobacter maroccanus TaxID=2055143 RepID=A0A2S5Z712_9GAMM|nr:hypothetical protein KEHDKFFH_16425 [Marinobacter maroccanus]
MIGLRPPPDVSVGPPLISAFESEDLDMAYSSNQKAIGGKLIRSAVVLLCATFLASCSYGPPQIRAYITNARAKPDSHWIAVAVEYQHYQEPTGINAFPNGGIPKYLSEKVKIYLCNVETLEVRRLVSATPPDIVKLGWQPWVLGWVGESLYFQISGQKGTSLNETKTNKVVYRIDGDGQDSEVANTPDNLVFQQDTGPLPKGSFVRISNRYDTIAVRTERDASPRTLFKIDINQGELVAIQESNKPDTGDGL